MSGTNFHGHKAVRTIGSAVFLIGRNLKITTSASKEGTDQHAFIHNPDQRRLMQSINIGINP